MLLVHVLISLLHRLTYIHALIVLIFILHKLQFLLHVYYFMNIPVFLWYWLVFIFTYFSSHFYIYLNKSMFINGFFSLFLGSWLEVKKRPKTPIHLRIFRTKKKANTWSTNLLLLEEEYRTLNAPIHSHVHGQTAAVIPGTLALDRLRFRGLAVDHPGTVMPAPEAISSMPSCHTSCAYKYSHLFPKRRISKVRELMLVCF